jgi:hypothetical protein
VKDSLPQRGSSRQTESPRSAANNAAPPHSTPPKDVEPIVGEVAERDIVTSKELFRWLEAPSPQMLDEGVCHTSYLMMKPGIAFVKNLPLNSLILEIGCGEGSLRGFRDWLGFERKDLRFYGASLAHGSHTREYEYFFVGDIEKDKPTFEGEKPNCAVLLHFIEHLRDPGTFLEWFSNVMPQGSKVYIEWPGSHTTKLPRAQSLRERGYEVTTINFHDDSTHVNPFTIRQMMSMLGRVGFDVYGAGHVDMPFIADALKHHGIRTKNAYLLTVAIHLKTLFNSFVLAVKR